MVGKKNQSQIGVVRHSIFTKKKLKMRAGETDKSVSFKDEVLFDESIQESHVLYQFKKEKPFTIIKDGNDFIIKGEQVEKIFKMINFNTEEAISRFAKKLRNMGVDEELEKMGVKEGDIIKILDYEFEYTK